MEYIEEVNKLCRENGWDSVRWGITEVWGNDVYIEGRAKTGDESVKITGIGSNKGKAKRNACIAVLYDIGKISEKEFKSGLLKIKG